MNISKHDVTRPLVGIYPHVYVDGAYLKHSKDGKISNISILVAIGISTDGYREIIGQLKI